ncbi:MAG: biotin/lipoate A/B protein ligase family protein [Candidatus Nanohaloarchaea archaeon]
MKCFYVEEYRVDADLENGAPAVYDAATNMALDEYILDEAADGTPYLRIYGFEQPAFVPSRRTSVDDVAGAAANGHEVTRRNTNGSTIPCLDNGVAYSVAYPTEKFPDRFFEENVAPALVDALDAAGVETDRLNIGAKHDSIRYGDRETPGEAAPGKTLVGSSLWRKDDAVMAHGVVAAEPWDAEILDENMDLRPGEKRFVESLPSLEEVSGYEEQRLVEGLVEGFTGGDYREAGLDVSEVEDLLDGKYRSDDWVFSGSETGRGHCFVEEEDGEFY